MHAKRNIAVTNPSVVRLTNASILSNNILQPTLCLHYLVPPPHDAQLLSLLRVPSKFPRILNQMKK